MSEKDGGPAFPGTDYSYSSQGTTVPTRGMSLRDWFAGQVISGLVSAIKPPVVNGKEVATSEGLAEAAYMMADWLIIERNK